ncbi:hypothetical protein T484DRAFT_1761809 [Baffinella frigidus]|nr:hypothetical protein T484DRAFT_1761809 [Cryptophyta sp. CCMP2293]
MDEDLAGAAAPAFGGFGAAPAATATAGFGGFGAAAAPAAAAPGGFGAFGAPAAGGAFGAPAATGGFGAPAAATGAHRYEIINKGSNSGLLTLPLPVQMAHAAAQQPFVDKAKRWLTINDPPQSVTWRTQYVHLPEMLKSKLKVHQQHTNEYKQHSEVHQEHINECKQHSEAIRDILQRRHSAMAGSARGGDARSSNGSNAGADLLVDRSGGRDVQGRLRAVGAAADGEGRLVVMGRARRLRHWLDSLKTWLKLDRGKLEQLQGRLEQQKRQMEAASMANPLMYQGGAGSQAIFLSLSDELEQGVQEMEALMVDLQHEMEALMVDLQHVLQGSINRPASYPPELIEQANP